VSSEKSVVDQLVDPLSRQHQQLAEHGRGNDCRIVVVCHRCSPDLLIAARASYHAREQTNARAETRVSRRVVIFFLGCKMGCIFRDPLRDSNVGEAPPRKAAGSAHELAYCRSGFHGFRSTENSTENTCFFGAGKRVQHDALRARRTLFRPNLLKSLRKISVEP